MPVTQEHELQQRIESFLTFCQARNLSPNTVRAYRGDLSEWAGQYPAQPITRKLVRAYLSRVHENGATSATARRKLAAVKSFCRWLNGEGLVNDDIIDALPTGPRLRQALPDVPSEADMAQLLDGRIPSSSPKRDRVILELLYGAGLRVSELTGINLADIQDKRVLLVRGKGKKERRIVFGEPAQRAIEAWLPTRARLLKRWKLKSDALIFNVSPRKAEGRLSSRSVARILKSIAVAKGLPPYHPHALRHACGTHMHDHGASLQLVATYLGHSRLSTAQIYTRVSTGRMLDVYRKAHPHARLTSAA